MPSSPPQVMETVAVDVDKRHHSIVLEKIRGVFCTQVNGLLWRQPVSHLSARYSFLSWQKGWLPTWWRTNISTHRSRRVAFRVSPGAWNIRVSSTSWSRRPGSRLSGLTWQTHRDQSHMASSKQLLNSTISPTTSGEWLPATSEDLSYGSKLPMCLVTNHQQDQHMLCFGAGLCCFFFQQGSLIVNNFHSSGSLSSCT